MKEAVAVDRVNNRHQDSIPFGLDHHKSAFEPLRVVPRPPASLNGTTTNGHGANMADADDIAVRTALEKLSVEEQVSLLAGADFWRTVALPQHGIPSIKTSDGPNGARGEFFKNGTKAALFPCGVSLAATWDVALLERVGMTLGDEALARGASVLLAPTVCMHRSPLGGRNFESFSEDPLLTGALAAAYVRGLQRRRVAATIKHFVGNEQETHRMKINSVIGERALREIYLRPFEIAVREARPWAVMSSYNLVNGLHSDMNDVLLKQILRQEWGYDGLVMSDWTGTNSVAESIKAGCDLEMPGPTRRRGTKALAALARGELSRADISRSAARVLKLVQRTKGLDGPVDEAPERSIDTPETRALIREAGAQGITLLKNEGGLLPLDAAAVRKIALIGPNAVRSVVGGGGSATLNPYYTVGPAEGIRAAVPGAEVTCVRGCDAVKWLPLASGHGLRTPAGEPGVTLEYYKGDAFAGQPLSVQRKDTTDLFLWDSAPKAVLPAYSFRVRTRLTPRTTGAHTFSFSSVGPGRLYVGGALLVDNWDWEDEGEAMFEASEDVLATVHMRAGEEAEILVESTNEVRPRRTIRPGARTHGYGGVRIGFREEESGADQLAAAVAAARAADAAVVVVGLDAEWESEGYDRQAMDLPRGGSQDRLVEAVLAANPRTVVVCQSGSPVTLPWVDRAPALLQAWYQGQEAGHALADVLFGRRSPGGKLPMTWPRRIEDTPAHGNWPGGADLQVRYDEGVFVGYRHYEARAVAPLFPFGHGLSYARFEFGAPAVAGPAVLREGGRLVVRVPVINVGRVAGSEVVQAYVREVAPRVERPVKELRAFAKVMLQPGERRTAELVLDRTAVGFYDVEAKAWVAEKGQFEVLIGASSADIRSSLFFEVEQTFSWIF